MKEELFRQHYERTTFVVNKIQRREMAFQPWTSPGPSWRHNYFQSINDLKKFLTKNTKVSGVFASTGYFLDPNEKDMTKRGYLGHDLVFDIDSPLKGSRRHWLDEICNITYTLKEVLCTDLGFDEENLELEFSGNKGFHFLIKGKETMDVTHRRQITQYLLGENLTRNTLKASQGGWGKTFYTASKTIGEVCIDNNKYNEGLLILMGLPKLHAKKIGDQLTEAENRSALIEGRPQLVLDKRARNAVRNWAIKARKDAFSTIDKAVTIDKNRVLRVAGSIHPKSGLVCTKLELDDLNNPETILEKLKEAGGTDEVEITLTEPALENFERMHRWEPGTYTVPRWLALHLLVQN